MYPLQRLFINEESVVYPTAVLNSDTEYRKLKVEIKYGDSWVDITSHVARVELEHLLSIEGSSALDKAVISLHSEEGQFDFMKITDTFDPLDNKFNPAMETLGGIPFLVSHFPVKITLVYKATSGNETMVELFHGYAATITSRGTKSELTVYDVLYQMSRKISSLGLLVSPSNIGGSDAYRFEKVMYNLLSEGLAQAIEDFGNITFYLNGSELTENAEILTSQMLIQVDGGKSYFEMLSEVLKQAGGFVTYIPKGMELHIYLPADESYTFRDNITTSYTIDGLQEEIDKFELEQNVDLPNRLTVKTKVYEIGNDPVLCWVFDSGAENANAALRIPKNSISTIDISFNQSAFPSKYDEEGIILDALDIRTYEEDIVEGKPHYYLGGSLSVPDSKKKIPFETGWFWGADLEIKSAEVGINKITMDIKNYSTTSNYCITLLKAEGYPLLEAGENSYVCFTDEKPIKETEFDTCYFVNADDLKATTERVRKVYYTYNTKYFGQLEFLRFLPDIYVGGILQITLPDTTVANNKCIVSRVYHKIDAEQFTTTLEVKILEERTYNDILSPAPAPTIPKLPTVTVEGNRVIGGGNE